MNLKLPLFASLTVLLSFVLVQAQTGPESWKRYTLPGHEFSVVFPTLPAMTFYSPSEHEPWRIEIGAYADGAIYIVRIYENTRGQRSLSDFVARIVSGLPYGLTEQAIAAAKKIKFVPAMKDGHYVSMWMQLEYNFNLY